jgi:hypothetical protein
MFFFDVMDPVTGDRHINGIIAIVVAYIVLKPFLDDAVNISQQHLIVKLVNIVVCGVFFGLSLAILNAFISPFFVEWSRIRARESTWIFILESCTGVVGVILAFGLLSRMFPFSSYFPGILTVDDAIIFAALMSLASIGIAFFYSLSNYTSTTSGHSTQRIVYPSRIEKMVRYQTFAVTIVAVWIFIRFSFRVKP